MAREERVRDESEALLDEASYDAARAERFARTPSAEAEPMLERAFIEYLRALSGGRGVSRHRGAEGEEGVWAIRPDNIPHGEITIIDKDAAGEFGKRVGTFRREIAQRQRSVEFFTYGNPLFDAVVAALGRSLTGRTYAITCHAPGAAAFAGLEIIVAARPLLDSDIAPSLLNMADALFGTRRRPLFVPLVEGNACGWPSIGSLAHLPVCQRRRPPMAGP